MLIPGTRGRRASIRAGFLASAARDQRPGGRSSRRCPLCSPGVQRMALPLPAATASSGRRSRAASSRAIAGCAGEPFGFRHGLMGRRCAALEVPREKSTVVRTQPMSDPPILTAVLQQLDPAKKTVDGRSEQSLVQRPGLYGPCSIIARGLSARQGHHASNDRADLIEQFPNPAGQRRRGSRLGGPLRGARRPPKAAADNGGHWARPLDLSDLAAKKCRSLML